MAYVIKISCKTYIINKKNKQNIKRGRIMKRGKIIISLAVCLLSLGMLVFGVYSTVKVEFGFGGVLSLILKGYLLILKGMSTEEVSMTI